MSPEQVSGDPRRLDIRSDVYALGVLTFEILTGALPYDLDAKTVADAALTLREAQPLRLGADLTALRGDLDTIIGKALEKDPARRYESAAALADDLRRFLAHRPIVGAAAKRAVPDAIVRPSASRPGHRRDPRRRVARAGGGRQRRLCLALASRCCSRN